MTTPHQPLPTSLETLLGIGAFQIGGSGTSFGQDIDSDFVDTLVKIPYATLTNMLDILREVLLRLPIEALQAFSSLVPDWLEEPITDVLEAVDLIIDALTARDIPMLLSVFEDFVEDMLGSLGIPSLGGLPDKILDLVDGFDEWFGDFDGLLGDFSDLDGNFLDLFNTLGGGSGSILTDIIDRFQHLGTSGVFDASALGNITNIPTLNQSSVTGLPTLAGNVVSGFQNMFNNWFGGTTAVGTVAEVAQTFEAIRASVGGGFTLQTFTSSNAAWSVPSDLGTAVEAYAGAIGGGGKGGNGTALGGGTFAFGGAGGSSGGYQSRQFDPSTLGATLNITVGVASSTIGAHGGTTSIVNGGTTLATSFANQGSIATSAGFFTSVSLPGQGGAGGGVNDTLAEGAVNGSTGEPSATSAGGAGGIQVSASGAATGGNGSAGVVGQTASTPVSGGGGGGGGGGAFSGSNHATAGSGGAGGFPGGGGGGGGAVQGFLSETVGAAGSPANGLAFLLWR